MSKELRVPDYLAHILDAIERIGVYVGDVDRTQFGANRMLQDATVRNLENIGEAVRNITRADPSFAAKYPELPLARAIGMRNRLVHGYFDVNLDVVWQAIKEDLPELYRRVREILSGDGEKRI